MTLRSRFPMLGRLQIGVRDVAVLRITDGTVVVDLVSRDIGIHLTSWFPARTKPKGGGTYKESALTSGRQLVSAPLGNPIESFTFHVTGLDQDAVARQLQDLDRLLNKAMDYWASAWSDEPVWIMARSARETNYRYATIMAAQIESYGEPYAQPFTNNPPNMVDISMTIERLQWQNVPPLEAAQVPISAFRDFNNRRLGNVNAAHVETPTTAVPGMYVTNKDGKNNLTHMFQYDASAVGFGTNMFDGVLPHKMFSIPPLNGDMVYFGSAADINSVLLPFSNLIFDLVIPALSDLVLAWEYWGGAAWVTLLALDHTVNFNQVGVNSVNWLIPSNWVTTTVNGVLAYWVRCRITSAGSSINPEQGNEYWYTANWPYAEIKAANIGGDMPALVKLRLVGINDRQGATAGSEPRLWANRVIYGLRSLSRDLDPVTSPFRAFMAASNTYGSAIQVVLYANTAFVADIQTPYGEMARYTPIILLEPFAPRVVWRLESVVASYWGGEYRMFVRSRQNGGAVGDFALYMQVQVAPGVTSPGQAIWTSPVVTVPSIGGIDLIDLGRVTLGEEGSVVPGIVGFILSISGATANTLDIFDLILIPQDEAAGDLQDTVNSLTSSVGGMIGASLTAATQLVVDSATYLKGEMLAVVTDIVHATQVPTTLYSTYRAIKNGPIILQHNAGQRLWILTARRFDETITNPLDWRSNFDNSHYVSLEAVQRYDGLRGNR